MAKYVKNPAGGVHSIEDDAYEAMLQGDGETEQRYLPHGWTELKEHEARKAHPQLFGERDPQVVLSAAEAKAVAELKQYTDSVAADPK